MRLRAKNTKENMKNALSHEPIDLTEIFSEEGEENPLYDWVREADQPLMDEAGGRPNSHIAIEIGINVNEFMENEVTRGPTGLSVHSINDDDNDVHLSNGAVMMKMTPQVQAVMSLMTMRIMMMMATMVVMLDGGGGGGSDGGMHIDNKYPM
ncbi:hypothetical protein Scep_015156 [Stephania cephalantha]|uniref:Uncharacterized protein n=1 Tax=Stephania cephalantha TaxID=152367 RepID=A0AAP0P2J0_9MAGN